MNSAKELLDEVLEKGIHVTVTDGVIKCRSARPLSSELISRLRIHKDDLLRILRQQRKAKPYLSDTGEFRVSGLLPPGTMLDALLEVGASDEEIGRHIGRQTPYLLEQWQVIKQTRTIN